MSSSAAIGFRAHSGWAAAVAIAGPLEAPSVITRRRIEMVDHNSPGGKQPYHAAADLELDEARQIVADSAARAASMAATGIRTIIKDLQKLGHEVVGCGLLLAAGRPLPALESILAAHPLIHTAEGEHFREALRAASRACGLPLVAIKERDLPIPQMQRRLENMGRAIGPPWQQDQKYAAIAACLVLAGGAGASACQPTEPTSPP